jgi:hypothetical protein
MAEGTGAAPFNPPVPNMQDPNFAFWARPIREPLPNKGMGIALAGAGKALEEGTTAADYIMKRGIIEPELDQKANIERDQFINSVNAAKSWMAAPSTKENQPSLLPDSPDKVNVPTSVARVGETAAVLQNAMESGKLSETYYYGRLNALAKDMRARYPGYRDFIDSELGRITGVHPANQYIRSLLADQNRMLEQRNEPLKEARSDLHNLIRQGDEGAATMADKLDRGEISVSQARQYSASQMAFSWKHKNDEAQWKLDAHTADENAKFFEDGLISWGNGKLRAFDETKYAMGTHEGTYQELQAAFARGEKWTKDVPQEMWDNLTHTYALAKNQFEAQLRGHMMEPVGPNGESRFFYLGGSKGNAQEKFKAASELLSQSLDARVKDAANKDYGSIGANERFLKEIEADQKLHMMRDPNWAKLYGMFKELPAPLLQTPAVQDFIRGKGVDQSLRGVFDESFLRAATQPEINKPGGSGKVYTFADDLKYAKEKGITDDQYAGGLFGMTKLLTDPNSDRKTRENIAHYFFDGPNAFVMKDIKEDYTDADGNKVPGKYAGYSTLFNTSMAKSIKKLATQTGDNGIWDKYESAARTNATILFGDKIQDLNNYARAKAGSKDWYHFSYNTDTGNFSMVDAKNQPIPRTTNRFGRPSMAQDLVDKLSIMGRGLKQIEGIDGKDSEAVLLNALGEQGIDIRKLQGLPADLVSAIMAGKMEKPKEGRPEETAPSGPKSQDRVSPGTAIPMVQ